nr:FadR/GntR family transcriptional regulator [uncultured Dyadobacter sp.]
MMIRKTSLADEVANQIRVGIQNQQFAVDQQLPIEADLMKLYGVGRSTIREAVRMLANAGFLRVQQGVGTFVEASVSSTETLEDRLKRAQAHDIDEVRRLLEVQIVRKAAQHSSQHQLDEMEKLLDQRGAAALDGNLNDCIKFDIDFHLSIADACGNDILRDIYKAFSAPLNSWFHQYYADTASFVQSHNLHKSLFKSIKKRDADKAQEAITQILSQTQYS